MKYVEDATAYRRSLAPCAKGPGNAALSPLLSMELRVLRLAADAADIRRDLGQHELAKCARLAAALQACEALFEAMGWGDQPAQSEQADHSGH